MLSIVNYELSRHFFLWIKAQPLFTQKTNLHPGKAEKSLSVSVVASMDLILPPFSFNLVTFSAGIMIFATVLGYVANIVSNISAARKDFQGNIENVF